MPPNGYYSPLRLFLRHWRATDFDRVRAGYSPDRVDALVWRLTELLVQPMAQYGMFEVTRQRAAEINAKTKARPQVEITYAPSSMEWQEQQERKQQEA